MPVATKGGTSFAAVAQVSKRRSVGIEADSTRITKEVIEVTSKSVKELIASDRKKLSPMPSGGAASAVAPEEKKEEKKMDESESKDDDMDCGFFE